MGAVFLWVLAVKVITPSALIAKSAVAVAHLTKVWSFTLLGIARDR